MRLKINVNFLNLVYANIKIMRKNFNKFKDETIVVNKLSLKAAESIILDISFNQIKFVLICLSV